MKTIKFEKGKRLEFNNLHSQSVIGTLNRMANRYEGDKSRVLIDMAEVIDSKLKLGIGGSHIWCCNSKNERIFIIEF
jgi:hypothetical protein